MFAGEVASGGGTARSSLLVVPKFLRILVLRRGSGKPLADPRQRLSTLLGIV
jgi:hypothetical protein